VPKLVLEKRSVSLGGGLFQLLALAFTLRCGLQHLDVLGRIEGNLGDTSLATNLHESVADDYILGRTHASEGLPGDDAVFERVLASLSLDDGLINFHEHLLWDFRLDLFNASAAADAHETIVDDDALGLVIELLTGEHAGLQGIAGLLDFDDLLVDDFEELGRFCIELGNASLAAEAHLSPFVDHFDGFTHRSEFLPGDSTDVERIGLGSGNLVGRRGTHSDHQCQEQRKHENLFLFSGLVTE